MSHWPLEVWEEEREVEGNVEVCVPGKQTEDGEGLARVRRSMSAELEISFGFRSLP